MVKSINDFTEEAEREENITGKFYNYYNIYSHNYNNVLALSCNVH